MQPLAGTARSKEKDELELKEVFYPQISPIFADWFFSEFNLRSSAKSADAYLCFICG
jgi:hypothetical protein